MDTSFDNDDDGSDGDDDFDNGDDDYEENFDEVLDSDGDGFSDDYEEFIGSDPKDPTDLPFYPYEDITEQSPKKKIISPPAKEEYPRSIWSTKGSPTRNKCLLFLILFIIFLIMFTIIVFIILS